MKIKQILITALVPFFLYSCEKQPGEGGRAIISGQVYQNIYDNNDFKSY